MKKPRILFMGTPAFAVPALALLLEKGYPFPGIVTQPDRPQGRGRTLQPSPVKVLGQSHHISILQPERIQADAFIEIFRQLSPDLVVLAAYGQLLPKEVIDRPPLGCLNIHPSILPKYRGAAPINWSLINGDMVTGVTIMYMTEELDGGDIILQEEITIEENDTFDQLHDRLSLLGAELLARAIEMAASGTVSRVPQDASAVTYAPRLRKEDSLIKWNAASESIVNLIRGLSSVPGAFTILDGKKLKILKARPEIADTGAVPGTVVVEKGAGMKVATGNGWVHLLDVQLENKKRMPMEVFLSGYRLQPSTLLG